MEPHFRKRPTRPKSALIISTGIVLLLTFLLVVLLFFLFSSLAPLLTGKCVAVVELDMPFTAEGAPYTLLDPGYLGSEELAVLIESINERDDVGAVVFVVNSPGGSVVATREVYNAVHELEKPKVAYFREIAASGAYYVASGTDYIISDPDALTGSIGVVATSAEMSGLLEKIGVNVTTITSGRHKDIGSPYRNMTSEEEQILQALVDEVYEEFRAVVVENRRGRLNMALFDEVTDGRILSGRQAAKVGLVDKIGTKKDAIMKAADLANMSYETYNDIRVCPVSTSVADNPALLSAESFLSILQAKSGVPELSYK